MGGARSQAFGKLFVHLVKTGVAQDHPVDRKAEQQNNVIQDCVAAYSTEMNQIGGQIKTVWQKYKPKKGQSYALPANPAALF